MLGGGSKPGRTGRLIWFSVSARRNAVTEGYHKQLQLCILGKEKRERHRSITQQLTIFGSVGVLTGTTGQVREPRFKARHGPQAILGRSRKHGLSCRDHLHPIALHPIPHTPSTPSASHAPGASSHTRLLNSPAVPSQPVSNERAHSVYPSLPCLMFCHAFSAAKSCFIQCSNQGIFSIVP